MVLYSCTIKKQRPSPSFSVAAKFFVLALFGTTIHLNVYYAGLEYTSPKVACALTNVIPSLTFLMAVLLGLEKLKIRIARGQAKVAGTLFCIVGSLVFPFWKGGYLFKGFVKRPWINISVGEMRHVKENWIKGALLILTSHIAWSAWLILQFFVQLRLSGLTGCGLQSLHCSIIAKNDDMPFRIMAIFFSCPVFRKKSNFMETGVEPATFNHRVLYIFEPVTTSGLHPLLAFAIGSVISALAYYLQTWCMSYKGPVFASMFSPLQVIIVALFSAIAFTERLHFGSLIGAFLWLRNKIQAFLFYLSIGLYQHIGMGCKPSRSSSGHY
ncbi:unnamed protein product [Prunus armeniaca]